MAGGSFVLDDILQHLNLHQYKKLAELWIRLEILTDGTIPSFSQEHLNAAGVVTLKTQSGNDLKIDMSFLHRKPLQKALLELSQAQLSEALRRNVKHEDPDTLLVRFLRAHNWKLDDAMVMLLKNIAWRIEKRIEEDLIPGGDLQFAKLAKDGSSEKQKVGKEVIDFRSSGEHFVHGQDKEGRLLEFIRVKLHNPKAQGPEAFEKGTILDAENTRMLLRPPVTTASAVFDLTGFGMSNMVRRNSSMLRARTYNLFAGHDRFESNVQRPPRQLPGIPRQSLRIQRPVDRQRHLVHDQILAEPYRRIQSALCE